MKQETIKRILSSIIILPIALFFIIKGSVFFAFFLISFFLITSYEWYKMSKNIIHSFLGIIFLFLTFYSAYLFRGTTKYDLFIFLFVITICIATDIGGYVFGKLFKGPKLSKISPNKTYSGMIGSYLLSIIFANLYLKESTDIIWISSSFLDNDTLLLVSIFLISSVSQLGDLFISYFKRLSKIKNTGKIIPGHGGLLDRVDGLIFAVPFAYFLFKLI
tara:strand:+ start:647 stop:1300 length:654 start_codon:yes stop_codon:yes gene_type:complete